MRTSTLRTYLARQVRKEVDEWTEEECDKYIKEIAVRDPSIFISLAYKRDFISSIERTNINLMKAEQLYIDYERYLTKVTPYRPQRNGRLEGKAKIY